MELNDFRSAVRAEAMERAYSRNFVAGHTTYGRGVEDGIDAALYVAMEYLTTALLTMLKSGIPE